jgi:Uma2 family endonuclease
MIIATPEIEPRSLLLDVSNTVLRVTPEHFDILCQNNPDLRLELSSNGELIVMPPTGGETGEKNFKLAYRVGGWNDRTELGRAFDSSTGYDFTALGGGKLSPDVSWIEKSRLEGIDIRGFIPVVPDFVIELRSNTDKLGNLQAKMHEYRRLGVRLGLLVNPQDRQVEIYRENREVEVLDAPVSVNCDEVMSAFILSLKGIL